MRKGYTLVELLIVITIIGVLTTIAFVGFGKIQADARDKQRQSNATIIAEALEKYYDKNGEYPSTSAVTDSNISTVKNLLGIIDSDALTMPKASSTSNSITATTSDIDKIAYNGVSVNAVEKAQCEKTTVADGGNLSGGCDEFTLQWKTESGNEEEVKSRHQGRTTGFLEPPSDPVINTPSIVSGTLQATLSLTGNGCTTGTLQYRTAYNTTGVEPDLINPISDTGWLSSSNITIPAPATGLTYYFYAIARCSQAGSAAAVNPYVADNQYTYASAGAPTVSANWSGTNAVVAATVQPCTGGTLKFLVRYTTDNTSPLTSGTAATLLNWTTNGTGTLATNNPPRMYRFATRVICDTSTTSGVNTSGATGTPSTADAYLVSAPLAPVTTKSPSAASGAANTVTWTWTARPCPAGTTAEYQVRWLTDGDVGNGTWTTMSSTSTSRTTSSQGYTYGNTVQQRCKVNSSLAPTTKSLWSLSSNNLTYLRDVSNNIRAGQGGAGLYNASSGNGLLGRVKVRTTDGSCGSGAQPYIYWRYDKHNYANEGTWPNDYNGPIAWNSNFTVNGGVGDLDFGHVLEYSFTMRCKNTSTGVSGVHTSDNYRDHFGNIWVTRNRTSSSTGAWQTRCSGSPSGSGYYCDTGNNCVSLLNSITSKPSCEAGDWGVHRGSGSTPWGWN